MKRRILNYWRRACRDWNRVFLEELRRIVRDEGVLVFCLLLPLAYPLLYAFIYTGEVVRDVPVAVVDASGSVPSREFVRRMDATADVLVAARCADMDEAQRMVRQREVYGVVYVPEDFARQLARGQQTHVSIYTDMGSMLYYKAMLTAATDVALGMNAHIKAEHLGATTDRQAEVAAQPIAYTAVNLFNPQTGFAAFLIPAVLVLILQQTLLLGIGIAAGTAREENRFRELAPYGRLSGGLLRIVLGKGAAFALVYLPMSVYVLGVVPRLFSLNQVGQASTLALFVVPYLLACIFFAMTVSLLLRHRETCILVVVFTSLPLLFLSGVSWPGSSIAPFWRTLSALFPSTAGINGFLKINNMGATLPDVAPEWHWLWGQAVVYFLTTCLGYRASILASRRRHIARHRAHN